MAKIRIRGGTVRHDKEDLCHSCAAGAIRRGESGREFVYCTSFARPVLSRTVECSVYYNKNQTSLWDMRQQAWIINPKKAHLGFRAYKDMDADEKEGLDEEFGFGLVE